MVTEYLPRNGNQISSLERGFYQGEKCIFERGGG
jgi:hypothetical protein